MARAVSDKRRAMVKPTKSVSLADRAYEELRDRIVTLKIPPGSPLDEDPLMTELGMGRTPIREAIKRLALERLAAVYPRRGTFASDINITDLADLADLRTELEGHAAARAAERLNATAERELDRLITKLEAVDAADASSDHRLLMELDANVHRFIYRTAQNVFLEECLTVYFNLSLRIWYLVLDRLPAVYSVEEHIELLRAIKSRDPVLARTTLARHIRAFEEEIRRVL
jgi:DNA-binding GntR family transcriptional regulator